MTDVPPHRRNQALFKKGICLEKLGDRENALATFYKIIEEETRPDRRQREFFWFYKAGFNAARLLEDDSHWEPAAVVYQKLASAGGARSEWKAKEDFAGTAAPKTQPLTRWEEFAQVLLLSNEFMFVD